MPANRPETLPRLLAAATAVFAELGYDGSTLDAVAERAGLTKGALYHRFASKQEVLLAALSDRGRRRAEALSEVLGELESEPSTRARAARIAGHLADVLSRDEAFDVLLVEAVSLARRDPSFKLRLRYETAALRDEISELLELRASALPHPGPVPPEQLAAVLSGLACGLSLQRSADPVGVPGELLSTAVTLVLTGAMATPR